MAQPVPLWSLCLTPQTSPTHIHRHNWPLTRCPTHVIPIDDDYRLPIAVSKLLQTMESVGHVICRRLQVAAHVICVAFDGSQTAHFAQRIETEAKTGDSEEVGSTVFESTS